MALGEMKQEEICGDLQKNSLNLVFVKSVVGQNCFRILSKLSLCEVAIAESCCRLQNLLEAYRCTFHC